MRADHQHVVSLSHLIVLYIFFFHTPYMVTCFWIALSFPRSFNYHKSLETPCTIVLRAAPYAICIYRTLPARARTKSGFYREYNVIMSGAVAVRWDRVHGSDWKLADGWSLPPARSVYTAEYIYRARVAIHGNPIYVHGALGFIYIYII